MRNINKRPVAFNHRLVDTAIWTKSNLSKKNEKIKLDKVWFSESNIFFPDKQNPQPQTSYVSSYMAYVPETSTPYINANGYKEIIPPFSDGESIQMVKGFISEAPWIYKIKFHREMRDNNGKVFLIVLGLLKV